MTLHPIRQRAVLVGIMIALAIGALVGLSLIVFGAWLDLTYPLSASIRRVILLVTATCTAIAVVMYFRKAKHASTDEQISQQIDRVSQTDGTVLAGFDLMSHGVPTAKSAGQAPLDAVSADLASIAAEQAEVVCRNVDPVDVIPTHKARFWWRNVAIAFGVLFLIALVVPRMAWTQAQRMLVPLESQLPYSPTSLEVSPGDVEVLFGSDVEFTTEINGPVVDDLELVLRFDDQSTETLPMLAESDVRWRTYLTRVTGPADYFVRANGVRSHEYRMDVRLTPEIESVTCVITPPAYTNRAAYRGPIPESGIEGLAGTKIELTVKSNRPLQRGLVRLGSDDSVRTLALRPVSAKDPVDAAGDSSLENVVTGQFTLTRSESFELSVTDVDGIPSSERIQGALKVLPDQTPVVRLLQPKPISFATPDIPLPVVVAAEDDFGFSRVELFRGLNGSPELGRPLEFPKAQSRVKVETSLPLASSGLEPGDEITLFARVEDNDPNRPKGAESPIATVRIISHRQLAELELSRRGMEAILSKQRHAQRLLENLQKELAKTQEQFDDAVAAQESANNKNSEETFSSAMEQLKTAAKQASSAADAIRQSANQPLPVDVDQSLSEQLGQLADKIGQIAERLEQLQQKLQESGELTQREQLELGELIEQLNQSKQEHDESGVRPAEQMSKIMPLIADQQRYSQLASRQRNLADRIDALQTADPNDPVHSASGRGIAT